MEDRRAFENPLAFLDAYPDPEPTIKQSFLSWLDKILLRMHHLPGRTQLAAYVFVQMICFNVSRRNWEFVYTFSFGLFQYLLILRQPRRSTDPLARVKELQWGFQLAITLCFVTQIRYMRSDFLLPFILKHQTNRPWIKGDFEELVMCRAPAMLIAFMVEPRILAPPMFVQGSIRLWGEDILRWISDHQLVVLLSSLLWVPLIYCALAVCIDFVFALGVLNALFYYVLFKWTSAFYRGGFPDERIRAIDEEVERELERNAIRIGDDLHAAGFPSRSAGVDVHHPAPPERRSVPATQATQSIRNAPARRDTRPRRRRDSPSPRAVRPFWQKSPADNERSNTGPNAYVEARSWREALHATYIIYRSWLSVYLSETLFALYIVAVRVFSLYTAYRVTLCLLGWGLWVLGVLLDYDRIQKVIVFVIRVLRRISLTLTDVDLIRKPFLELTDEERWRRLFHRLEDAPWKVPKGIAAVSAFIMRLFGVAIKRVVETGASVKGTAVNLSVKQAFAKRRGGNI